RASEATRRTEEDETMKRTALFEGVRRCAGVALFALAACAGGPEQVKDPPLTADPPAGSSSAEDGAAATELQRAEEFITHEKYDEARSQIEAALKRRPTARAHFDMGVVREKTKDLKGAEESYKEALKLDPKLSDAALNLAALYLDGKRADDAIALLKAEV